MLGFGERGGRYKSEARSPISGACDTNVFLPPAGGVNEPSHVPRAVNIGNLAHRNRPASRPEPSRSSHPGCSCFGCFGSMGLEFLSGPGGKMKRASVRGVPKRLSHNRFGGCESVPESVL